MNPVFIHSTTLLPRPCRHRPFKSRTVYLTVFSLTKDLQDQSSRVQVLPRFYYSDCSPLLYMYLSSFFPHHSLPTNITDLRLVSNLPPHAVRALIERKSKVSLFPDFATTPSSSRYSALSSTSRYTSTVLPSRRHSLLS
jgi:hypothetical protein